MLVASVGGTCSSSLWMRKVALKHQGSIFALLQALGGISTAIVVVLGSFIAENVVEHALTTHRIWSDWISTWMATGRGHGLRLVFVICGTMGVMFSTLAFMHKRLRNLESLVPDGREDKVEVER